MNRLFPFYWVGTQIGHFAMDTGEQFVEVYMESASSSLFVKVCVVILSFENYITVNCFSFTLIGN